MHFMCYFSFLCFIHTFLLPIKTISKLKKAGEVMEINVTPKIPLLVRGNKKLLVVFMSTNRDAMMLILRSSDKLASAWSLETVEKMSGTALIFSEREGSNSVKVCKGSSCKSPMWSNHHLGAEWVWANVALGTGQNHWTVEGDSDMVAYVYGGARHEGYATAGVCSEGKCTRN